MPAVIEIGHFSQTKYEWGEGILLKPGSYATLPHFSKKGQRDYVIHAQPNDTLILKSTQTDSDVPHTIDEQGRMIKHMPLLVVARMTLDEIEDDKNYTYGIRPITADRPSYILNFRPTPEGRMMPARITQVA